MLTIIPCNYNHNNSKSASSPKGGSQALVLYGFIGW